VEVIRNAAGAHGVDPGYLVSVASCESGLDPHAVNPAGYYGLFQFDRQTWAAYGKGSIFDPVAQSNAAAYLVSIGQSERWPVCG
jgi:soluble lytic murein transglycosylase-like protein